MYALMALLALLASAFFVHAFVYRRRGYLPAFAVGQALMLYTHSWGIFFGVGAVARAGTCGGSRSERAPRPAARRRCSRSAARRCCTCRGCRRCSTRPRTPARRGRTSRASACRSRSRADVLGGYRAGGRAAARRRLRPRALLLGAHTRARRPRAAVGVGADRDPARHARARAGCCRSSRRRGPRATSPRSSARWCC